MSDERLVALVADGRAVDAARARRRRRSLGTQLAEDTTFAHVCAATVGAHVEVVDGGPTPWRGVLTACSDHAVVVTDAARSTWLAVPAVVAVRRIERAGMAGPVSAGLVADPALDVLTMLAEWRAWIIVRARGAMPIAGRPHTVGPDVAQVVDGSATTWVRLSAITAVTADVGSIRARP